MAFRPESVEPPLSKKKKELSPQEQMPGGPKIELTLRNGIPSVNSILYILVSMLNYTRLITYTVFLALGTDLWSTTHPNICIIYHVLI